MLTYSRLCKEGKYANALCPTDFNFSQLKTLQGKVANISEHCYREQKSSPFCFGPLISLKIINFKRKQPLKF